MEVRYQLRHSPVGTREVYPQPSPDLQIGGWWCQRSLVETTEPVTPLFQVTIRHPVDCSVNSAQ